MQQKTTIGEFNIDSIIEGNQLEFARMVEKYSDDLFLFSKGILSDTQGAEEVVSDVFLKLWNNRQNFGAIINLKSYLYTAVRNHSISFIRAKNKRLIALEDLQDYHFEPVESVENDLLDQEILDKIHRAIDCLPTQTKMVFSLAKVQGLKYKEIGELLNIKVKTVDYHVASAIKKISIMLDNEKSHNSDLLLKTFLLLIGG